MIKVKKSLKTRIWTVVFLAVLLSSSLVFVASLLQARKAIRSATEQRMLDIANCAAESVDGEALKDLTAEDEYTVEYQEAYNALAVFRDSIAADYIYGIREEKDGRFTFTVDPTLVRPAEFGDEVVKTDALVRASKGKPSVDKTPYTDDWGTFYSAYSPVYDLNGDVAGIIAVDYSREWYEGQQAGELRNTFLLYIVILLITLMIVGIICYTQIRTITAPMEQIAAVADSYRQGAFVGKLEIEREDEIGVLSQALQSMASSLMKQISEAREANRAKSDFLASMSHEIRTPINAILGMNEMNLREATDPQIISNSENIREAGTTLLGIINDILDFSKIESGKVEIISVNYDVASVINDLVNMIYTRADEKGLTLELDFDQNLPRELYGDEVRIKQVITNLLTNAVKYTDSGSVAFRIGYKRIDEDIDNVLLTVSIKDTGIGIRQEDMSRLFSEFERIEELRNRNIEGTGLGLSITANLLEMMGSKLNVESVYGEGSEFGFVLRQKVVDWEPLGDYETAFKRELESAEKYRERFTAPEAKVLVVDDNPMNINVFTGLVKQTLVKVDTANSGDEAIALCEEKKYDLIFLDHMMPVKDGIETLHEIRANENNLNAQTPTICLTANAISGAREQYLSEGFEEYLTKPIDSEQLEKMMVDLLPKELIEFTTEIAGENDSDTLDDMPEIFAGLVGSPIDLEAGLKNSGSWEAYLSLAEIFYRSINEKAEELNDLYAKKDTENYAIKVHSLKSSARILGASDFGERAQRLENAAKSENMDNINKYHGSFINEYMRFEDILANVCVRDESESDKPEADEYFIKAAFDDIREAADEMDCDRIESAIAEMEEYSLPEGSRGLFEKVRDASRKFEYDTIVSLLSQES